MPEGAVSGVILGATMNPERRLEVIELCREAIVPVAQAVFHRLQWTLQLQDPGLPSKLDLRRFELQR